jgi:hypothetical protein
VLLLPSRLALVPYLDESTNRVEQLGDGDAEVAANAIRPSMPWKESKAAVGCDRQNCWFFSNGLAAAFGHLAVAMGILRAESAPPLDCYRRGGRDDES